MLKIFSLSMTFAVALGFAGAVQAGGLMHGGNSGCTTCGLASPQGTVAPVASSQSYAAAESCDTCAPAKSKCNFLKKCFTHAPKMYTYEWVLKKKRVHGHKSNCSGCDTCGGAGESYVTPSAQGYASPQGATYAAPQATYGTSQYGSGQASVYPTTEMKAAEPVGDAVPPAPSAPAPSAPAAPAPPAPAGAQSSLLFLSPAGN